MRVLVYPQYSMTDSEGKYLPDSDSNFTIARLKLKALDCLYDKASIVFPHFSQCDEKSLHNAWKLIADKKHSFLFMPMQSLVRYDRFDFSFDLWRKVLKDFDLVLNDNEAVTRNLRTAFDSFGLKQPKVFTGINFPAFRNPGRLPLNVDYFWRQVDAIDSSDAALFHSYIGWEKFSDVLHAHLSYDVFVELFSKARTAPCTVDEDEFKLKSKSKNSVLYVGRFYDDERTKYSKLLETIKLAAKKRDDFTLNVTAPNLTVREAEKLESEYPIVVWNRLGRKDFVDVMLKSSVVLYLYNDVTGGIGIREACAAGCLPVFAPFGENKWIAGHNYPFYVDNFLSPDGVADVLCNALDYAQNDYHLQSALRWHIFSLYCLKRNKDVFVGLVNGYV